MASADSTDLFNNPAMKQQFQSLPPEEQEAYRKAGEYMYSKDYTSEKSAVDDAIEYIKIAFSAGMMPSQLTNDELEFLRNVYGSDWYKEFGFPSENYTGLEKKTTKRKPATRPTPIKMPSVKPAPIKMPNTKQVVTVQQPVSTVNDLTSIEEDQEYENEIIPYRVDETVGDENEIPPEELEINRQISYVYTVWS
jgi:hypothetical protein